MSATRKTNASRAAWLERYRKQGAKAKTFKKRSTTRENGFDLDATMLQVKRPPSRLPLKDKDRRNRVTVVLTGVHKLVAAARKLAVETPDLVAKLPYEILDDRTVRILRTAPAATPDSDKKRAIPTTEIMEFDDVESPANMPSKFVLRDGLLLHVTYFANSVDEMNSDLDLGPFQEVTLNAFHINAYYKSDKNSWMATEQCGALIVKPSELNAQSPEDRMHALIDLQTQTFRNPLNEMPPVPFRPNVVTLKLGGWAEEDLMPQRQPDADAHEPVFYNELTFYYTDASSTHEGLHTNVFTYKSQKDETMNQLFPAHRQRVSMVQQPDAADPDVFEEPAVHKVTLYSAACSQSGICGTKAWKAHQMVAPIPFYGTFEVGKEENMKGEMQTSFYPVSLTWPMKEYLRANATRVSTDWAKAYLAKTPTPEYGSEHNAANKTSDSRAYVRCLTDMDAGARDVMLGKCSDVPASTAPTKEDGDRWELYVLATRREMDYDTDLWGFERIGKDLVGNVDAPVPADSTAFPTVPKDDKKDCYTLLAVRVTPPPATPLPEPPRFSSMRVPYDLEELDDAPALTVEELAADAMDTSDAPAVDADANAAAGASGGGLKRAAEDEPEDAAPPPKKKSKKAASGKKGSKKK